MTGTVESVENEDIRGTGWVCHWRRCPEHETPLELRFDETDQSRWRASHHAPFNHDDNRG